VFANEPQLVRGVVDLGDGVSAGPTSGLKFAWFGFAPKTLVDNASCDEGLGDEDFGVLLFVEPSGVPNAENPTVFGAYSSGV